MRAGDLPPEAREVLARLGRVADEAAQLRKDVERDVAAIRKKVAADLAESVRARKVAEALVRDRVGGFALIANAWADYERARADTVAARLELKTRPARKAADELRAKGRELACSHRRAKLAEYLVAMYESHFPWLVELRDFDVEKSFVEIAEHDETDPVSKYVSREEWGSLSSAERNQRALDRYLRSRKTAWQLGRDYERYVG
jgi:hypothetical protein